MSTYDHINIGKTRLINKLLEKYMRIMLKYDTETDRRENILPNIFLLPEQ